MYDHMLVDTRNCLYRAIYAGISDNFKGDYTTIFFRFMNTYIQRFKPKNIHFFWDAPKETIWRKSIYPEYKEGRVHRNENTEEYLNKTTTQCLALLPYLNCRIYERDRQEADDLIYAFCHARCKDKIIIISSDSDFRQISYRFNNIDLYNPLDKSNGLYQRDCICDPIELKCFMGEDGDNLPNYTKIGPVKAKALVEDFKKRKAFFKEHGIELYRMNRNLIDLAMCPYLDDNIIYIHEKMADDVVFDYNKVMKIIQEQKIRGIMSEANRLLVFKFLGQN